MRSAALRLVRNGLTDSSERSWRDVDKMADSAVDRTGDGVLSGSVLFQAVSQPNAPECYWEYK
ncbi:hypothetical protein M9458_005156, partial [Cirrhinus mrigala]